jgi:hypothetical protein
MTRGVARVSGGHIIGGPKSEAGVRDVAIPPHILPAVAAHLEHVEPGKDALLPGEVGQALAAVHLLQALLQGADGGGPRQAAVP